MKTILLVASVVFLAGCGPSVKTLSHPLPDELKDCKLFRVTDSTGLEKLTIVRCPNSTTSTRMSGGNTQKTVIVVDGVEYERREK